MKIAGRHAWDVERMIECRPAYFVKRLFEMHLEGKVENDRYKWVYLLSCAVISLSFVQKLAVVSR